MRSLIVIASIIGLSLAGARVCGQGIKDDKTGSGDSKPAMINVSGVYPQLALFNEGDGLPCNGNGMECGIGAITPWAGRLWMVTYSPHCPNGSSDKLYSLDPDLRLTIHAESIGGTPANRMIHKESNQLITGSYFIDANGKVRVVPLTVMPGRMTATARHLTDPANKVYFYDMEGKIYEVNVHTLAVTKLFNKPVPGWHGKGAYTAQNRFIIANNGEDAVFKLNRDSLLAGDTPHNPDEKGILASWDGKKWLIIERKQFTDVTGPGGIYGSPDDKSPVWSIGWDKRSVILKLLDNGQWYTYRLPKAAHTYDHWGGWYTEWPRIRDVGNNKMLMDMHGMFYDFPKRFSRDHSAGIAPISTHLRYIPDFCDWNGNLVLSTDETTKLENPLAGRSQSNLWFGKWNDLSTWGAASGWGGPWINDTVKAGRPSDDFLVNGFNKKVLHLSQQSDEPVTFTLETDKEGNNQWQVYKTVTVPAKGYRYFIFPGEFAASWIRIKTNKDCVASAFFHYTGAPAHPDNAMFETIAGIDEPGTVQADLIRPAAYGKNLQVLDANKKYVEINDQLKFVEQAPDSGRAIENLLLLKRNYEVDAASVIVKDKTGRFRLPKTSGRYSDFAFRDKRELESERYMLNAEGTFYEVGRESGFAAIRPVTTHMKKIIDFCTWRGLLVISGTKKGAKADGHYFANADGSNGLWFGAIDDLWKMGKPRGQGGVWKNSAVHKGEPSLPFLMTGYDKKKVTLRADKEVVITLEVNTELNGWHVYKKIKVPAGKPIEHIFPDGYSAHWIRATADRDCRATVWFVYE